MAENIPPAPQNPPDASAQSGSASPTSSPSSPTSPVNTAPGIPFDISEEFGTAKKNLPSGKIVGICLAILIVAMAIFAFTSRNKPGGTGYISDVQAVEVPNQHMVMAAVNISFQNTSKQRLWIRDIQADLSTNGGNFTDRAAAAVDFNRYFQAFPSLQQDALPPVKPEDKIAPGAQAQGTIIVTFPVTLDDFLHRKGLVVTVWSYDQAMPIVLTSPKP